MIKESVARSFLREVQAVFECDVPQKVIARSRQSLLDYIGVAFAGAATNKDKTESYLSWDCGPGAYHAIGVEVDLSLKDAVYLNGFNSHTLDMDDGVNEGIIHLGSPIFSLLLPLAEKQSRSGRDLLLSAIIGYEVAWTLAASIQPQHKLRGYHATGTCGMLGAIVAGAHYLRFSEEELFRAFSVGCVSAGSTLKVLEDESELKPYNVAKAALLALISLQTAKAGYSVPVDAMSGSRGFLKMMSGENEVKLRKPLSGGRYAIMRTYTKPYAACRYCHPAIEAAIELGKDCPDSVERSIESITVSTYDLAVYGHDHNVIKGSASAKMSTPYGVAVGYLFGRAGLNEYTDRVITNPKVLDLCSKVTVEADPVATALFPGETVARVKVLYKNGLVSERQVSYPLGEPENPMGEDGVRAKFREMSNFAGKLPDWAAEVISAVEEENLSKLLHLLRETK